MHIKQYFISWYFSRGANAFLASWFRVLRYVPRYFSLALLVRTLFAPWHRDVSLKSWRDFNPLKSSQRLLWNLFSRIIGAIVRLNVIVVGLLLFVIFFILGALFFAMYFVVPGVVIVGSVFLFTDYWFVGSGLLIASVFIVWRAWVNYKKFFHTPYRRMSVMELSQQPWFVRVWERIGIAPQDVPREALHNFDVFKGILRKYDLTIDECEDMIALEMDRQIMRENAAKPFSQEGLETLRPIAQGWHYGYTIHLDRIVEDMTRKDHAEYAQIPFYGHQEEMSMLELVLTRPQENNAMLLGEPGVGRRMLVHELARRIRTMRYEDPVLAHARVLRVDLGAAVAHAQESGKDPEYELHNLFHEAAYAGNVILVVENFETYMQDTRGFSFAGVIAQYAPLPTFRMIALTSENKFHESVENEQSLLMHFDVIHVKEMSAHDAMKTLFMRFYNKDTTIFTFQALREIVEASTKYTNTAPLPKRAMDLAMEVLLHWQKNGTTKHIRVADVLAFIHVKTGVPVGSIGATEKKDLLNLETRFHQHIIGQNEAVRVVADAVRRMRSGMARPHRPAGSFLFLGPTGVGKTEMAKTLASQYFGADDKMVRLDMSEYSGPQAIARLIGSRALGQKGRLTSLVQEHPYALLLLDELEKANSDVLDLFLQVLDEGEIHDAFGRKINFTTMIIIATSNAGAIGIQKHLEHASAYEIMKKDIMDTITANGTFRPEFINRFDDVVVFHPMTQKDAFAITKLLLEKFSQRIEEEQNIRVIFDDAVVDAVLANGYDDIYGARSLLRYIDDAIADALAKKLIVGDVARGEDVYFRAQDLDA